MDIRDCTIEYEVLLDATRHEILGFGDDENYNHCVLTLTSPNGASETFDCWNSQAYPEAADRDHILNMVGCVFDEATIVINKAWDEYDITDYRTVDAMRELLQKLYRLGFTEQEIFDIYNCIADGEY